MTRFVPILKQYRVWNGERMLGQHRTLAGTYMITAPGTLFLYDPDEGDYAAAPDHVALMNTLLRDSDGVQIWEGDIVEVTVTGRPPVVLDVYQSEGAWVAGHQRGVDGFTSCKPLSHLCYDARDTTIRVIGHVYDGETASPSSLSPQST